MSRALALAGRIVRAFRHDRRTLALVVVVPLVVMALIGYLVGDDREPLRVGVVGEMSDALTQAFGEQTGVEVTATYDDERAARRALEDGTIDGYVGAVREPCTDEGCQPVVVVSGLDVQAEAPIVQAFQLATAAVMGEPTPPGGLPGLAIERLDLPTRDRPSTISFAAPAMVTTFAFLFTFMLTSVAFLRERSSGTLDRLLASPITRGEILGGYLGGFLPFAAIQATLVLGYAIVVLDATVAGSMALVVLVLLLLVIGVVNLGIALSFYARNELQVVQFIPLVLLPQIFLGGLFWPIRTLWVPLTWLSLLFPVTHAVRALRRVMLGGAGIGEIATDLWALLAFAVGMIAVGVLVLRRQRA